MHQPPPPAPFDPRFAPPPDPRSPAGYAMAQHAPRTGMSPLLIVALVGGGFFALVGLFAAGVALYVLSAAPAATPSHSRAGPASSYAGDPGDRLLAYPDGPPPAHSAKMSVGSNPSADAAAPPR